MASTKGMVIDLEDEAPPPASTRGMVIDLEDERPASPWAGGGSAVERALAEPPDEVPASRAAPGEPRTPEGVPAMVNPAAHTKTETAALHAIQGMAGGFLDEAHGVLGDPRKSLGGLPGNVTAEGGWQTVKDLLSGKIDADAARTMAERATAPLPPEPSYAEGYRERRDDARTLLEENRRENPGTAAVSEIAGSIASPLNKLGPAAKAGAGAIPNIARAATRAGAQGAVYGAGASGADLTKLDPAEVKKFAKDVAIGAGAGTAVGAAGEGAGQLVRGAANWVKGNLTKNILNEVAEGTANTTPTGRKRLEKAGEVIAKEVIEGEDGKLVRKAYTSDAAKGREMLKPIIEKVAKRNDDAYEAFEKAGRSKVDPDLYGLFLLHAADAADKEGQTRLAAGLRQVQKNAEALAARTGGLDLQQLRGFTTEVQGQASSVLGSLNEHANAKTALQVQHVATKAMDDMLSLAAAGDASLTAAANTIRGNNQRFHALLTIDDGLRLRSYKESTGEGGLVRGAKALAKGITGGGIGAAVGGDERRIEGAALGAAAGLLVPGARATQRGLTTLAIEGARGGLPKLAATEAATGLVARSAARAATAPAPAEDPAVQLFRLAKSGTEEQVIKKAAELGIDEARARSIIKAMRLSREPVLDQH
jgi:hypothetical protein